MTLLLVLGKQMTSSHLCFWLLCVTHVKWNQVQEMICQPGIGVGAAVELHCIPHCVKERGFVVTVW